MVILNYFNRIRITVSQLAIVFIRVRYAVHQSSGQLPNNLFLIFDAFLETLKMA